MKTEEQSLRAGRLIARIHTSPHKNSCGFTLIELAVVLAVIGLLIGGAVASFSAVRVNAQIKETHLALDRAEMLLQAFLARNGRLPCPAEPKLELGDAGYGEEERAATLADGCADARGVGGGGSPIAWGTLPAVTLGMRVTDLLDGWDNQFFYVVHNFATVPDALESSNWTLGAAIELFDALPSSGATAINNRGVVALISPGPNRSGAYTSEGNYVTVPVGEGEQENTGAAEEAFDSDWQFVALNYSIDPDNPFDDIVRVFTEDDLVLPLALSGDVRSKRALTIERIAWLADAINAAVVAAGAPFSYPVDLTGIDASLTTDAWTNAIQYVTNAGPCTGGSFTLTSSNVPSPMTYPAAATQKWINAAGFTCP